MLDCKTLLSIPNSALAQSLQASLAGLAETLRVAKQLAAPHDPGQAACEKLLSDLRKLLDSPGSQPTLPFSSQEVAQSIAPAPSSAAAPIASGNLSELLQRLLNTNESRAELGRVTVPELSPSELLRWGQFFLLRLSPEVASRWRRELPATGKGGTAIELPGESASTLLPGCADPLVPEVRLRPDARLDQRLITPKGSVATTLARIVSVLFWFTDHDTELRHGYRPLHRFGLTPLTPGAKSSYQTALAERFRLFATAEAQGTPVEALRAWVDLDEALHSLAHNPLPSSSSWWGQLLHQARSTSEQIRQKAIDSGHQVVIREATGVYADVSSTDRDSDKEVPGPVPPGHVSRCLRLSLRIDHETVNGRAFYRAS
jgi:hypothetical protein